MNSIPTTKRSTILGLMTHVIVLTIVFILPEVIFTAAMGQRAKFGPRRFDIYIHTVMYIITFYVNYFILIDRLLFKKRTWLYLVVAALFAALMVVAGSYSHIVIDKLLGVAPPPHRRGHHGGGLFIVSIMMRDYVMLILTIGLSVALKMGLRWTRIEKLNERIITERKDMELRNLKNQLNPHFLFNTLNNIYALTAFDTEKAQNAIHQLSKLLRALRKRRHAGDARQGAAIHQKLHQPDGVASQRQHPPDGKHPRRRHKRLGNRPDDVHLTGGKRLQARSERRLGVVYRHPHHA